MEGIKMIREPQMTLSKYLHFCRLGVTGVRSEPEAWGAFSDNLSITREYN
jgi:hypothetical protein